MAEAARDPGTYAAAVDAIYVAVDTPSKWVEALVAIAACTGDIGAIFIYPRDGALGVVATPGLEAVLAQFASSEWSRRDLRYERALDRGYIENGQCVTDRHLVTDEEVETHPYYVDLLRPHGLKWFAGLNLSPTENGSAALSVQRSVDRLAFSDDELAVVARLGSHVERALRLSAQLLAAEAPGLARAGSATMAEFVSDLSGSRVGVGRAIEKHGVPKGSELGSLLSRIAGG